MGNDWLREEGINWVDSSKVVWTLVIVAKSSTWGWVFWVSKWSCGCKGGTIEVSPSVDYKYCWEVFGC